MAEIYVNCGKYDLALSELESVLSQETFITVNSLKFTRWLEPLREHSEYKRLMQQYALAD